MKLQVFLPETLANDIHERFTIQLLANTHEVEVVCPVQPAAIHPSVRISIVPENIYRHTQWLTTPGVVYIWAPVDISRVVRLLEDGFDSGDFLVARGETGWSPQMVAFSADGQRVINYLNELVPDGPIASLKKYFRETAWLINSFHGLRIMIL